MSASGSASLNTLYRKLWGNLPLSEIEKKSFPPQLVETFKKGVEVSRGILARGVTDETEFMRELAKATGVSPAQHLLRKATVRKQTERKTPSSAQEYLDCHVRAQSKALARKDDVCGQCKKTREKVAEYIATNDALRLDQQTELVMNFKKCGRCRKISYCSKECQTAHWKTHKPNCAPSS